MKEELFKTVEELEPDMVSMLSDIISFPALNPSDGGEGEYRKAQCVSGYVEALGLGKAEFYNCPDKNAVKGVRPNIVVRIPGKTKKRLWVISHMDVVPEGSRSLWNSDPFKAVVKDGRIYGRGVNDNGQELVSSLFAAVALKKLGITPEYEVSLCFVANEETGSMYGIRYLLKQNLFSPDDLIIVPDGGSAEGDFIEIAEKSIFWMEFTVEGQQVHGSMPDNGNNACRAANEFSVSLDEALHAAFPETNALFDPKGSTFEPTRRSANVPNVNTISGHEKFCFDCRVLPGVPFSEFEKVVNSEMKKIEKKRGVKISVEYLQKEEAPAPTALDAPVVEALKRALVQVIPCRPKIAGIGGGTCAAYFRQAGIPAAVWDQEEDVAHMPNEFATIKHLVNEAKVFALMYCGD